MLFIRTKGILRPTQQMRLSLAAMTLSREASDAGEFHLKTVT